MADITGVTSLRILVDTHLFKFKMSTEDAAILFEHAANCYRDIRVRHGDMITTEEVDVDDYGIITMPTSMMTFLNLGVYKDNELWTFTERPNLDVDPDITEEPSIVDGTITTYGSKGGINAYYYNIDWGQRKIFCEGITDDTAILKYVGTGISASADTLVPEVMAPMIDTYLLWMRGYWEGATRGEMADREARFDKEVMIYRKVINTLSYDQIMDVLWGTTTQGPQR